MREFDLHNKELEVPTDDGRLASKCGVVDTRERWLVQ